MAHGDDFAGRRLSDVEILEAAVRENPGGDAFSALAEAHRRAGDPEAALRVARQGLELSPDAPVGRAMAALALLDLGRHDEARRELEKIAGGEITSRLPGNPETVTDGELDRAFAEAEPVTEELIDADRIAHDAMLEADLALPEGFRTATMAELLTEQGDLEGAAQIRTALAMEGDAHALEELPPRRESPRLPGRKRETLKTLERWLANARGA